MSIKNIIDSDEFDVEFSVNGISSGTITDGLRFKKVNNAVSLVITDFNVNGTGSGSDTKMISNIIVPDKYLPSLLDSFLGVQSANINGTHQGILLEVESNKLLTIVKLDNSAYDSSPNLIYKSMYFSYTSLIPVI